MIWITKILLYARTLASYSGRPRVQISARGPAILTEGFRGFPQSIILQNTGKLLKFYGINTVLYKQKF
jgi:hypothetical protein